MGFTFSKMLSSVLLSCLLLVTVQGRFLDEPGVPTSQEQPSFWENVGNHRASIVRLLRQKVVMTQEQRHHIMKGAHAARGVLSPQASEECDNCGTIIGLLKSAIDLGLGFEDLRDTVVDICKVLVPDYDGEGFCEGTVDNYGPHAVYVLKNAGYTGYEICLKWNICAPDDVPYYKQQQQQQQQQQSSPDPMHK